jgi:hypothetical protein
MDCQLYSLPEAGRGFTRMDHLGQWTRRTLGRAKSRVTWAFGFAVRNTRRLLFEPAVLLQKARAARSGPAPSAAGQVAPAPLDLREGERVRVKSLKEIEATLDGTGAFERLTFMPIQEQFCGREFVVRQRIDRFFDERAGKMLRTRRMVILEDVFCQPPADGRTEYSGCQRSCFIFWKDAWLERV